MRAEISFLRTERSIFAGNDPNNNQLEMTLNPVSTLLAKGDRSVAKMVQNEYADLREHEWADSVIEKMLDDIERDVLQSGAFQRDRLRWPEQKTIEPYPGFDDFRHFVIQRFHSMDEYIGNL